MSRNPTPAQMAALAALESQARLVAKNKELARAHLLHIQLLLARRVPVGQK
jgi:hypothetical protein